MRKLYVLLFVRYDLGQEKLAWAINGVEALKKLYHLIRKQSPRVGGYYAIFRVEADGLYFVNPYRKGDA